MNGKKASCLILCAVLAVCSLSAAKKAKKSALIDKTTAAESAVNEADTAARSKDATAQEDQVIGRYYGPDGAYRVDVLDDGTFQYFGVYNGEFIHYAHGTYSGNINAPGTVAIRLSQYLHDYEWVTIPECFGTCNAVLADDGEGAMTMGNWSDVEAWAMRLKGR